MSEKEIEKDIRNLDSVNDAYSKEGFSAPAGVVGFIMENFRFGYGGYNGYFENWESLEDTLKGLLK